MKKLIVNADDFGLTRGVNRGIVQAFREGILTSTTIMANGPAFDDAVEQAQANPALGVGCHLVLVGGRAVARPGEVPSLVDSDGRLAESLLSLVARLACGIVKPGHIERELRAQVERIRGAGIEPTHFDTHKHTHILPQVMEPLAKVANEFGITRIRKPFESTRKMLDLLRGGTDGRPSISQRAKSAAARAAAPRFRRLAAAHGLRTPDYFFGIAITGRLGAAALLRILEGLPDGTSELMCHPGVCDEDLDRTATRLKHQREVELAGLLDPAARRASTDRGIELISYREFN
jgi:hopanoid biosynthesis associated protein HpnK